MRARFVILQASRFNEGSSDGLGRYLKSAHMFDMKRGFRARISLSVLVAEPTADLASSLTSACLGFHYQKSLLMTVSWTPCQLAHLTGSHPTRGALHSVS